MRIIAFDHFFNQDLAALREGLRSDERMDVLPYRRLHKVAARHFPKEAFATLSGPFEPAVEPRWEAYRLAAQAFTDWVDAAYQPSVFVVPNDGFFYLRPVIARFRALGVRTVVVQKETTIAPLTMDEDSRVILRTTPFMADAMTVCSERHREFALRTGAPPEKVVVTGQPRFDFYARARGKPRARTGMPLVLYLSYDDLSYLPADGSLGSWRALRTETERVLSALASERTIHVVAKYHPQQQVTDDALGPAAERPPRDADTRHLVAEADVIVGFQTTALFEAAVAGKPVLYPAWGPVYERAAHLLIPFADHPELARHARSPDELRALLRGGPLDRPGRNAVALAEAHLGPVDGHATERVLDVVRRHAVERSPVPPPSPSPGRLATAALRGAGVPLAGAAAVALRLMSRPALGEAASRHAGYWLQEAREASVIAGRLLAAVVVGRSRAR